VEDSPLRHAPHTMEDLVRDWDRAYSREAGCFPPGAFRVDKYWPPVNRVDNAYGDRHLVCTCPPLEPRVEPVEGQASRAQAHVPRARSPGRPEGSRARRPGAALPVAPSTNHRRPPGVATQPLTPMDMSPSTSWIEGTSPS
jgi:hypothetical protein